MSVLPDDIHTKPSVWGIVATTVCTAFIALPTLHSLMIFGMSVLLQIGTVWLAHREGRNA